MDYYISDITRRDLVEVITNGIIIKELNKEDIIHHDFIVSVGDETRIIMPFYGRLGEINFLKKLYPLNTMPSSDSRFDNAEDDIWQHTINNSDWDSFWFFDDDRFNLKDGDGDEALLNFICEIIHPSVVLPNSPWKYYLEKFNKLLQPDGYTLYTCEKISGRDVYGYKRIDSVEITNYILTSNYPLKTIGTGSYAIVYEYKDTTYDQKFALKRAYKKLNEKERERFKREYDIMKSCNSPYVLKVYTYNEEKNKYIMECMDMTLETYINNNNSHLSKEQRCNIISELIKGFQYIHSKNLFHRDISVRNILVNEYEDTIRVKISDFGLVKIFESNLTSLETEFKGSLNDPELKICGFQNYKLHHEIYALTQLFAFIITGKNNLSNVDNIVRSFIEKGMNADVSIRFKSLEDLEKAALQCINALYQ